MASLYIALLGASTLLSAADSTSKQPAAQLVKLGLRTIRPTDLAISYERQLSPRWAVLGGFGYYGYSFRGGTTYHDYDDTIIEDKYRTHRRHYTADVQIRYYFRRQTPKPLAGWFTALALHNYLLTSREQHTFYTARDHNHSTVSSQAQLQLGRQWALGRRLTLDTYLGTNIYRRQSASTRNRNTYDLSLGWGVQMGYRFRPLARAVK